MSSVPIPLIHPGEQPCFVDLNKHVCSGKVSLELSTVHPRLDLYHMCASRNSVLEMEVFVFGFTANSSLGTSAHGSTEDLNQRFDVYIYIYISIYIYITS